MKTFFRFFKYLRSYSKPLFLANVFMLLFVISSLFSIGLIMPFIDLLFNRTSINFVPKDNISIINLREYLSYKLAELVSQYSKTELITYLCGLMIIIFFLKNLFSYLQTFFMSIVEQGIIRDIRSELYSHYHKLSLGFFTEEKKGILISRIINDVQIIKDSMIAVINSIFRDPPLIIIFSIVLMLFNWKLTLFIFALLPITAFVLAKVGNSLKRKSIKSQEQIADNTSILDETFGAMRIVKAFSMEEYEIKRFKEGEINYFALLTSLSRRRALAGPITEMIGIITITVILYFIGSQIVTGNSDMTPGAFFVYLGIFFQMMPSLKLFGQVFNSIQEGIAASERVFEILDTQPKIIDLPNAVELKSFEKNIEFKQVDFRYEKGEIVLKDINLEIKKGEILAIVGPSGAGKTSLADLIPRFYDVENGSLLIDGIDIRNIKISSLRGMMGIVTQETILFNDSIKNNIAYGLKDIDFNKIVEASKAANAHIFIQNLEMGYETIIGDRGMKLSGGERQRLSIARALLKNPPILILDEATSSLDTQSEILVQQAIERLMKGRTSIVIAHRLSTIKNANNIIVLNKGKIVERGNNEELLKSDGLYKKLYNMQFRL